MMDKRAKSLAEAVEGLSSGHTVMVSGFGGAGMPRSLVAAVLARGPTDLTVISNNAGFGPGDISDWFAAGLVAKMICSYPRTSPMFVELYRRKRVELELNPQGTLIERMRCAGAGLGGFYTPVSAGTELGRHKEHRSIDGKEYVLEKPLAADFALIRGRLADTMGNLTYNKAARNFGPVMATAARVVVAEVDEIVDAGELDPEVVVTPGIYVDRLVRGSAP